MEIKSSTLFPCNNIMVLTTPVNLCCQRCISMAHFFIKTRKPNTNLATVLVLLPKSISIWPTTFVLFEPKCKCELDLYFIRFTKKIIRFTKNKSVDLKFQETNRNNSNSCIINHYYEPSVHNIHWANPISSLGKFLYSLYSLKCGCGTKETK